MQILLDSNLLLRIATPADARHQEALQAIILLKQQGHRLVIVPQNLYELWCVATRSPNANGLGLTVDQAEELVERFLRLFHLLRDERAIYEHWQALVTQYQVASTKSFDTRLVAAMKRHGITHLLTLNARDFRRYAEIVVLEPQGVIASSGAQPGQAGA